MKVCVIQPEYSTDFALSDEYFKKELALMDECDESADLIVMPESSDIPCLANNPERNKIAKEKYNAALLERAAQTAKRCNAVLFTNARSLTESGVRNTTYAFNRNGEIVGKYYKEHLVPDEPSRCGLDSDYSFEFSEPTIVTIDGIRYGFMTCYDFYFYEYFAKLALYKPDIIIGCSHQRSDTHRCSDITSLFLAYNTNAYVVRASVSMDKNSDIGGGSLVAAPDGKMLLSMESKVGLGYAEIDPQKKYYKSAGFGSPISAHYEYIEAGRRPYKYRPAGSAIVKNDKIMPYPRICAHRGFNTIAPENSMPAFGAAVAMGAEEIEFDLWVTTDGEIVSCHDPSLERVSDGSGFVYEHSYAELLKYDFGIKYSEEFVGLKILKFEDILKKFACHAIMNIHLKDNGDKFRFNEQTLKEVIRLIDKYDCRKYVYFMTADDNILLKIRELAPDIALCAGAGKTAWQIVDRAIKYGFQKVQLFKPYFNREMIEKAHEHNIICNVFWSDDPKEAQEFIEMGIDVILTNDYNRIKIALGK